MASRDRVRSVPIFLAYDAQLVSRRSSIGASVAKQLMVARASKMAAIDRLEFQFCPPSRPMAGFAAFLWC